MNDRLTMRLDVTPEHELRRELQRLTDDLAGDRRGDQLTAIPAAAAKYGRSIDLVAPVDPARDYVCYQHAFEIEALPRLHALLRERDPSIRPDRHFVEFLIDNHLSEVETPRVSDGAIAIYHEHRWIKHAGRVSQDRVTSKWGEGHLWRHGPRDVPESYGESLAFFAPIPCVEVLQAFVTYARSRRGNGFVDPIVAEAG